MRALISFMVIVAVTTLGTAAIAAETSMSIAVKTDWRFGSDDGVLTLTDQDVVFDARDARRTRRWEFDAIRSVQIPTARRLVIDTYGSTSYRFLVAEGVVTPEFVAALLERFPRSVVTVVMPPVSEPAWAGGAWHEQRRGGHDGVLELHGSGLMFRSTSAGASRYWRFRDVASLLRLDVHRLEIAARESGGIRPYVFELKDELPDAGYDAIWRALHR